MDGANQFWILQLTTWDVDRSTNSAAPSSFSNWRYMFTFCGHWLATVSWVWISYARNYQCFWFVVNQFFLVLVWTTAIYPPVTYLPPLVHIISSRYWNLVILQIFRVRVLSFTWLNSKFRIPIIFLSWPRFLPDVQSIWSVFVRSPRPILETGSPGEFFLIPSLLIHDCQGRCSHKSGYVGESFQSSADSNRGLKEHCNNERDKWIVL